MKKLSIILINLVLLVIVFCFVDFTAYTIETFNFEKPLLKKLLQSYYETFKFLGFMLEDKLQSNVAADVYGKQYKAAPVILTGCSFANGYDLPKEENFSYKLAELLKRPIYNYSVNGGTISTALYMLDNNLINTAFEPEYLIYVYITNHKERLYRYFNSPRENMYYPKYKLKNGSLTYMPINKFLGRIYLYKYLNDNISVKLNNKNQKNDINTFFSILISKFRNKYKNIKILILLYEKDSDIDCSSLEKIDNVKTVSLSDIFPDYDFSTDENYQIDDKWHPNGRAWDLITPEIVKILNSWN